MLSIINVARENMANFEKTNLKDCSPQIRTMTKLLLFSVCLAFFCFQSASGALLESWENGWDGWNPDVIDPFINFRLSNSAYYGVTDGQWSFEVISTGQTSANFPELFAVDSQRQNTLTSILSSTSALTLDVYAPLGSFGGNLSILMFIVTPGLAGTMLNSEATTIGQETTLTFNIPTSLNTALAASPNGTDIQIDGIGGFTAGNETVYLDNLRTVAIPEPAPLEWHGLGILLIVIAHRGLRGCGKLFNGAGRA